MHPKRIRIVRAPVSALIVAVVIAGLAVVQQQHPRPSPTKARSTSGSGEQSCPRARSTPQAPVSATRPAIVPKTSLSAATGEGDPGPEYSTYLGGTSSEFGIDIAVDDAGNTYVTGQTISPDFPTTAGAFDTTHNGLADAFVTKLDASGSVVYSTYLGGTAAEAGLGIAVDDAGNAYVSGGSASPDFPVTPGAFDTSHNGNEDVFVAKLNPDGSAVLWATFLGGSQVAGDFAPGIDVDADGNVYVSGGTGSPDFPTTSDALDATHNGADNELDAFVAKLDPTGSQLLYSTFLGGKCKDASFDLAVAGDGTVFVTGDTVSEDFPTTRGAFDRRYKGKDDSFVAHLDVDESALVYSTYIGGKASDLGRGIAVDDEGDAYVTGWTTSSDLPTTGRAFDRRHNGGEDAFVAKLNAEGSDLVYATYLGGSAKDRSYGVAVDGDGRASITGWTASEELPTSAGSFAEQYNGGDDGFVATLDATGSKVAYATYLGGTALDFGRGIALDSGGIIFVTGRTESADYPTTTTGSPTASRGARDVFVAKLQTGGN